MPTETAATRSLERVLGERAPVDQPRDGVVQRHVAAADRGGARAAVGLEDIAVDDDLHVGQQLEARHRCAAIDR